MTLVWECEVLKRSPLFEGVDPNQLKLLLFLAEARTFHPGEELTVQGTPGDAAFLLVEGLADVEVAAAGAPTVVARIGAPEIVGEMALLSDSPRTATVRAAERVRALRIDQATLLRMLEDFPGMARQLLRVMATRLERTTRELARARAECEAAARLAEAEAEVEMEAGAAPGAAGPAGGGSGDPA